VTGGGEVTNLSSYWCSPHPSPEKSVEMARQIVREVRPSGRPPVDCEVTNGTQNSSSLQPPQIIFLKQINSS